MTRHDRRSTKVLPATLLLVLCAAPCPPTAAADWIRSLGRPGDDSLWEALETPGGGFVIAGTSLPAGQEGDAWAMEIGPTGQVLWEKAYGTPGDDAVYSMAEVPGGGYLLAGLTPDPLTAIEDAWLVRIDTSGGVLWQKAYGTDGQDLVFSIRPAVGGGFFLVGTTSEVRYGDIWILKIDAAGGVEWSYGHGRDLGHLEVGSDARATADGGLVVAGSAWFFNGQNIEADAVVLRVDAQGQAVWHRRFGGSGEDHGQAVALTDDGFLVAGSTQSFGTGDGSLWLLDLDPDGEIRWQKTFGSQAMGLSVERTAAGEYLVGGVGAVPARGDLDGWILKLDAQGRLLRHARYGGTGEERILGISEASDGGVLVLGDTRSFGTGDQDGWALKIPGDLHLAECCLMDSLPIEQRASGAEPQRVTESAVSVPVSVRNTSVTPVAWESEVSGQCGGPGWEAHPGTVSDAAAGEPPLKVLPGLDALVVEGEPDAMAYHVYADQLGSWYAPRDRKGSVCGIAEWIDNGDGTVTLPYTAPAGSWFLVTASNLCGEGPAGARSSGTQRTGEGSWVLCGAAP